MAGIHPLAVVSPQAIVGHQVNIGPFCVVESGAVIGDGCKLLSHVVIREGVEIGCDNTIHEGTVLGGEPQHLAAEEPGRLQIGNGNTIRENVTIHRGLAPGEVTSVGDNNLIMVGAHIAHDCHIANNTIIANNVLLAGHIEVGNRAYLSGAVAVHQFVRIGEMAMVGGQSHVKRDVPPFVTVDGQSSLIVGLNVIGLRRNGFTSPEINELKAAYRTIYRSGLAWNEMLDALAQHTGASASRLHEFLSESKRGFMQERRASRPVIKLRDEAADSPSSLRKAG